MMMSSLQKMPKSQLSLIWANQKIQFNFKNSKRLRKSHKTNQNEMLFRKL